MLLRSLLLAATKSVIAHFPALPKAEFRLLLKKYCKDLDISLVFTSYKLKNMFVVKDAVPIHCVPLWFTNFHVRAVAPVMSVRPPDIFPLGFGSIYFQIVTPIFTNI